MITNALVILFLIFLFTNGRYKQLYIFYKTIGRDISLIYRYLKVQYQVKKNERCEQTVAKIFTELASKYPNRVGFYFEDEVWTLKQIDTLSNKIGNYFKKQGFIKGDIVALLLESRPEYVITWLGLSKIGVVTALINTNLVYDSLKHCIEASHAKAVVFGDDYKKAIENISEKLSIPKLYQFNVNCTSSIIINNAEDMAKNIKNESYIAPKDLANGKPTDKLLFIYTSGTTGLPKAAVISNIKYIFLALGFYYLPCIQQKDIIYNSLPLYHSAGGVLGVGQCLVRGLSVVIRKKFSASNFWRECVRYNCTVIQYIGEMCRYILLAHATDDKPIQHSVKKMVGNGLKPQIWKQFVEKFNIANVFEFYGATEGNTAMMNIEGKFGIIGFEPMLTKFIRPLILIKCDESTGEPIRNSDGFCSACQPGEPGILVAAINSKIAISEFEGYADKTDNKKKILKNVFKINDVYFNSGDILVQDEFRYYYFKDRTGDTFRWKGENVSTCEIEAIISNIVGLSDAIVYGVEVPGTEGRAGMAAIVDTTSTVDTTKIAQGLKDNLPSYAIPIFLRIITAVEVTGTFKFKKVELRNEGFDVNKIKDKLFLYDSKDVKYVELTKEKYEDIVSGKMKL